MTPLRVETVTNRTRGRRGEIVGYDVRFDDGTPFARAYDEPDARLIALSPELVEALKRTLPLLCRLGDFIGNGDLNPDRPESLGERCDVILDIRNLLARLDGRDEG